MLFVVGLASFMTVVFMLMASALVMLSIFSKQWIDLDVEATNWSNSKPT